MGQQLFSTCSTRRIPSPTSQSLPLALPLLLILIVCYHNTLPPLLQLSHISIYNRVLGAFAEFRKATLNFVRSVSPSVWRNAALTGRIFMKFDIWIFFENLPRTFKFHSNLAILKVNLHKD